MTGYQEFWSYFDRITDVFWKLERMQDFREPGSASWEAMAEGDWDRSLRLLSDDAGYVTSRTHDQKATFVRRRVRVAEHPITPYLQWEMHLLRWRYQHGEQIRVLPAVAVAELERERPLPELVVLGTEVLYEVRYDATGALSGARRIQDQDVIFACRRELAELYDQAEDLLTYFAREIAHLPPPAVRARPAISLRGDEGRRARGTRTDGSYGVRRDRGSS